MSTDHLYVHFGEVSIQVLWLSLSFLKNFIEWFLLHFYHYHLQPHTLFHLHPPPSHSHNHPTVVCLWILSLSPSFLDQFLTPKIPTPELSACSLSGSLSLFCLFIWFIRFHLCKKLYGTFSDWLISLGIMFSRFIHTVSKGKTVFFFIAE